MISSYFKTFALLAILTMLFVAAGGVIGGQTGMIAALGLAMIMNLIAYWNADKLVLRMAGAVPADINAQPELVGTVQYLSRQAELPVPAIYIINDPSPNAFATGRNPENSAVAVSAGLLELLSPQEVAAVIAHELAHIKHRDTLIMTLAACMASAISILGNIGFLFAGRQSAGRSNPILILMTIIFAPIAAMLVQMAISRSREYAADAIGAKIANNPRALASALEKIEHFARARPLRQRNPAAAHLFIINPLFGGMGRLFSTHPSTAERIKRLNAMDI